MKNHKFKSIFVVISQICNVLKNLKIPNETIVSIPIISNLRLYFTF